MKECCGQIFVSVAVFDIDFLGVYFSNAFSGLFNLKKMVLRRLGFGYVGEEVGSFAYPAKSLEEQRSWTSWRSWTLFKRSLSPVESANVHSSA
jgi:hypothetical protein